MNTNEMTVEDVIKSPEFKGELTKQIEIMRQKMD